MKFLSLLCAILVFVISAANAKKERAQVIFMHYHRTYPIIYKLLVFLPDDEDNDYKVDLHTINQSNRIAETDQISHGILYHNTATRAYCKTGFINDNAINGGNKTLRIDLTGDNCDFHFEGESVTDETIENVRVVASIQAVDGTGRPRLTYNYQHRHSCNDY